MWNAYVINNTAQLNTDIGNARANAFRPPQWSDQSQTIFARTIISNSEVNYIFDAIIRQEHTQMLRVTEHPVQTGANIIDHAYQLPATLMLEIGMSDAMDTFFKGQFNGPYTKSVNAYQKIKELQSKRQPLEIHTRLDTYRNMVIEEIRAQEDYKTLHALKCVITLRQIIMATVEAVPIPINDRVQGLIAEHEKALQPIPVKKQDETALRKLLQGVGIE